nr:hypothetical protein [Halomonas sp. UBA3074]
MNSDNTIETAHLFHGGWKTSGNTTFTTITAIPLEKSKVFRISCVELVDDDFLEFRLHIDGKVILAPLNEGGSIFVQGKSVSIEQVGNGVNSLATWEIVQEEQLEFEQSIWVVYPQGGSQSLIAAFESEQEFVLGINLKNNGCSSGKMTVFIDGSPVADKDGNSIEFLEGSSIIGKGKIISVVVRGLCTKNNKFYGNIKIQKAHKII